MKGLRELVKKARDEVLKIISKLSEKKAKVARLFFNDFIKATDVFERKVYKARLYNFICRDCKGEINTNDKEFCKRLKSLLDQLG